MLSVLVWIGAIFAAGFDAPRQPVCSVETSLFLPTGDLTYLLAVAAPDTVLARAGPVRPTGEQGHWGSAGNDSLVFGQVFRLQSYGGAGAFRLDSTLAADSAREIVVVLWDYDAACQPTKWSRSARWAFADSSLYLAAELRDTTFWVDGRPTFDTHFAGEWAYPFDVLTQSVAFYIHLDSVGLPYRRRTDRLTAREVFRLVHELPRPCDWRERPIEAAGALAVAKVRHRDLLDRFPASAFLADHERWSRNAFRVDGNGALDELCGP